MIEEMRKDHLDSVMKLWLETNIKVHYFIPESYWKCHFESVKNMIREAEVYICKEENSREILGFIGLTGSYIGGIFVRDTAQCQGIGHELIEHVKSKKDSLSLQVYRKNTRAISFYLREGFQMKEKRKDEETGEEELLFFWEKETT